MNQMMLTGMSVQSSAAGFDAIVRTMNDYYPPPAVQPVERQTVSVRVTKEQHADLKLVAQTWNAMDKALGVKRSRKWKSSSVIARFIDSGLDRFWDQASGGRPVNEKDRKEFIARAVELLLAQQKHGNKK